MNILYDCTVLSNYNSNDGHRAGLFFVALNLLREMKKQGNNIELYCSFTEYYKIKNIKEFRDYILVPEFNFVNKLLAFIFYIFDFLPDIFQPYVRILNRLCNENILINNKKRQKYLSKFDVYFSPFTPPSKEIETLEIKKFRMLHDTMPINNLDKNSPKWFSWYYRIYSTINDKDFYLTNSEYTKKDVLKYFPFIKDKNIKTTLLGANDNFFPSKEHSPIEGKYVFSLCTLGKRKNLEFAIRNFFEFIRKNNINDLKLVLGGSVWRKYKNELNQILNRYDRSKIVLTGYIDEKELAKYYSNALCFIYPSLYEGFGLPVLEAMQCGCPVITSNTTSLPEVIGDAGIQITPTNDEELISAYEKMYFDSDYRDKCVNKGLARAKQFSWEKCAQEILDFIKSSL